MLWHSSVYALWYFILDCSIYIHYYTSSNNNKSFIIPCNMCMLPCCTLTWHPQVSTGYGPCPLSLWTEEPRSPQASQYHPNHCELFTDLTHSTHLRIEICAGASQALREVHNRTRHGRSALSPLHPCTLYI